MSLPFTRAEFFEVFARYNEAVWPLQLAFYALALVAVALALSRGRHAGRAISLILALLWAWMGAVYHLGYFRAVNPAAAVFGVAFLAGAAAFAWEGGVRNRLRFEERSGAGILLLAYALVGYPVLAALFGPAYPAMPTFGLPCPTTIFTIGMLALLRAPYPRHVFLVPVLWTLIGVQAALLLGVHEDLGLLAAAAAGMWLSFHGRRKHEHPLVS
jgi:hypothetical protein